MRFASLIQCAVLCVSVMGTSLPARELELSERASVTKYVFAHFIVSSTFVSLNVGRGVIVRRAFRRLESLRLIPKVTGPPTCNSRITWESTALLSTSVRVSYIYNATSSISSSPQARTHTMISNLDTPTPRPRRSASRSSSLSTSQAHTGILVVSTS
jgi:hypothetical protein